MHIQVIYFAMARSRQTQDDEPARDEETPTGVSDHEMFTILSNARRLSVLRYLVGVEASADLGTLVAAVAAEEFDAPVDDLARKQERRVYVALHQNHLPYLEEKGLVDWDRSRGVVSLRDAKTVERYLSATGSSSARSYRSPVVLSTCSLGLVVGYRTDLVDGLVFSTLGMLTLLTVALFVAAGVTWSGERAR